MKAGGLNTRELYISNRCRCATCCSGSVSLERKQVSAMNYRKMQLGDYEAAVALWRQAEGVKLRDADSREGVEKYLHRNAGLSFVAESGGKLVGTVMAGHDGRRGHIQHLAVEESYRRRGVATHLLRLCLGALANEGILKSHIHVLCGNELAKAFWRNRGWVVRRDIEVYSYIKVVVRIHNQNREIILFPIVLYPTASHKHFLLYQCRKKPAASMRIRRCDLQEPDTGKNQVDETKGEKATGMLVAVAGFSG